MQPPPRGCVLKLIYPLASKMAYRQPPPRGCVLKHHRDDFDLDIRGAAASARLCVETETIRERAEQYQRQPPPRGCVLKLLRARTHSPVAVAAASARLCVETS